MVVRHCRVGMERVTRVYPYREVLPRQRGRERLTGFRQLMKPLWCSRPPRPQEVYFSIKIWIHQLLESKIKSRWSSSPVIPFCQPQLQPAYEREQRFGLFPHSELSLEHMASSSGMSAFPVVSVLSSHSIELENRLKQGPDELFCA